MLQLSHTPHPDRLSMLLSSVVLRRMTWTARCCGVGVMGLINDLGSGALLHISVDGLILYASNDAGMSSWSWSDCSSWTSVFLYHSGVLL